MSESADNSSSPSPEPAQPFYGPRNRGRREAGAGTPPNYVTLLLTQHHLLSYTEDKKVSNWLLTFLRNSNWPWKFQIHNLLFQLGRGNLAKIIFKKNDNTVRKLNPDWWTDDGMI